MRIRRLHTSVGAHSIEAVNATPLIDVVMCLIIFFLIVGKLAGDRGLPVNLPQTGVGQEEKAGSVIIITIAKAMETTEAARTAWTGLGVSVQVAGEMVSDGKAVEDAVRSRLAVNPNASVQVRADRDLSFGSVEPVLRAAGQGGAKAVRLATERLP
jgi:biopolymer transport protein ExbD